MSDASLAELGWPDRAAARSPIVQRSRERTIERAQQIVAAAIRLIGEKGTAFTIQELAREAEVALQTFYRHFAGKDELLLAVMERLIAESCVEYRDAAAELPDPLSRLRFYVTVAVSSLGDSHIPLAQRHFVTSEHFRLQQLFPEELAQSSQHFTALLVPEIEAAKALGLLTTPAVERDAWFVTQLVMATFHHYTFTECPEPFDELGEGLWRFCARALGGQPDCGAAAEPPAAPTPPVATAAVPRRRARR